MKQTRNQLPTVSVVIPAYNEEKFLVSTLKSLKKQDYQGKFEIIVVDNASTDKTAQVARDFKAKVIFEPRKGVHFARQAGFEAASGDLIASTDADNIAPASWLSKLVTEIESDSRIIAVGGWFQLKEGPRLSRFLINYFSKPSISLYQALSSKKVLIGQNFMVKRQAFLKTAGFYNLTPMNEDLQLAQRLAKIGEIKLNLSKEWKTTTSPRRWRRDFFVDAFPYIANAISFALAGKVVIKEFKDIREEQPAPLLLRVLPTFVGITAFLGLFILVPASPVHAKIMPQTRRFASSIKPIGKWEDKLDLTVNKDFKKFTRHHRITQQVEGETK